MKNDTLSIAPSTDADAPQQARYVTADEFFVLAGKIVTEEVYIPALDRTLIVKALTAHDVQRARQDSNEVKNGRSALRTDREFQTMIFFYAAVNPDGTPFFQRSQIQALNTNTNYAAIQPGVKVALRLSGLDDEAEEAARKKHFEGSTSDD